MQKETKKGKTVSGIYRLISGLFYRLSESEGNEGGKKKECLSSLSISCIKDGSANTNLQGAHPPVMAY